MHDPSQEAGARLRASEAMGKALGAFVEKKEVTVEGGEKPIKMSVHPQDLEDRLAALTKKGELTKQDDEWLE